MFLNSQKMRMLEQEKITIMATIATDGLAFGNEKMINSLARLKEIEREIKKLKYIHQYSPKRKRPGYMLETPISKEELPY